MLQKKPVKIQALSMVFMLKTDAITRLGYGRCLRLCRFAG